MLSSHIFVTHGDRTLRAILRLSAVLGNENLLDGVQDVHPLNLISKLTTRRIEFRIIIALV